jgi:hypothetical protein
LFGKTKSPTEKLESAFTAQTSKRPSFPNGAGNEAGNTPYLPVV